MSQINWVKLLGENRVKAVGVPWSDKEWEMIKAGANPDDIRSGITEKEKKVKDKPVHHWTKVELIEKAKELEISFDENLISRGDLIIEINNKLNVQQK
jgi:hypothetical protein